MIEKGSHFLIKLTYTPRRCSMAKNAPYGDNKRQGMVRERSQTFNPVTQLWVKRDAITGQFMDIKADGTPFKGVRKEK